MKNIETIYQINCQETSDINEHLPTLLDYGKKCDHITEMGVRWVSSTWALLMAKPKKMISYDIVWNENISKVIELSKEYELNYDFIKADVLTIEIEETDLLFIDTLHTYNQLISELLKHSDKVLKYIILHDTETFGFIDERVYEHASDVVKSIKNDKQGLWVAVTEFLESEKGKNWELEKKYTNNNGLSILKKVSYDK
jgi:hypothetical protein